MSLKPKTRSISVAVAAASLALGLLGASPASAGQAKQQQGASARKTAAASFAFPRTYTLTTAKVAHWAVVLEPAVAHRAPSASSPAVTTLDTMTGDGTQNIVLILNAVDLSKKVTWYHVRLPILPNNSTGWVPRSALGQLYSVNTHLYVDRETDTLVLKKNGQAIFTTRVGTGHSYWPTPSGQFYIRDKLTDFNDPFYGPVAFGTSARSAVLTEWPGGGFIGVHGTNEPQILPGHVSHGCIRLENAAILQLAKIMPVGTPLTVT